MAFEETVRQLREGKATLRQMRQTASIEEKLKDLWRAQHAYVQIVGMRRPLRPWERPWNIMSDVRDCVLIGADSIQTVKQSPNKTIGTLKSRWAQSREPWILSV